MHWKWVEKDNEKYSRWERFIQCGKVFTVYIVLQRVFLFIKMVKINHSIIRRQNVHLILHNN